MPILSPVPPILHLAGQHDRNPVSAHVADAVNCPISFFWRFLPGLPLTFPGIGCLRLVGITPTIKVHP